MRGIGFRAKQPLNSAAYKEAVLPTILCEVNDENAGPPFHMHSFGCLNGRFELKATDEYTDSAEAHTVPALVCSEIHERDVVRDSCCGYLPPFGYRGDFGHGCGVSAFRPRSTVAVIIYTTLANRQRSGWWLPTTRTPLGNSAPGWPTLMSVRAPCRNARRCFC